MSPKEWQDAASSPHPREQPRLRVQTRLGNVLQAARGPAYFEVKPPRSFYQRYAPARRVAVSIAGEVLYVPPLELQIAYKLWLGSDKDFEDAVFLYAFAKS